MSRIFLHVLVLIPFVLACATPLFAAPQTVGARRVGLRVSGQNRPLSDSFGRPYHVQDDSCHPGLPLEEIGLSGTGMFIWKLDQIEQGDPAAIVTKARAAGLSFVIIKVADGPDAYNEKLAAPVVKALQEAGVKVWGWGWLWGEDPLGEAKIAIQLVQELGLDGYVLDAEHPYKGKATEASILMRELRAGLPNTPIALSSYRYPRHYPDLPWNEFLCYVDLVMPQVFWIGEPPDEALRNSLENYSQLFADLSLTRPVVPEGAAYSDQSSIPPFRPTADEITLFRDTAIALGMPAVSYWSWDAAQEPNKEDMWTAISGGASNWPLYTLDNGWLFSNDVRALAYTTLEDGAPRLLVANGADTTLIDGRSSTPLLLDNPLPSHHVVVGMEGDLYLATDENIQRVDLQTGETLAQAVVRANVLALASDGRLWAGTDAGLLVYDSQSLEQVAILDSSRTGFETVNALAASGDEIWAGGKDGLVRIERDEEVTTIYNPFPSSQVNAVAVAPNGALWIGTDQGAARLNGDEWQTFTPADGLASPVVNDIDFDQEGGVWFATDAGAIRYDPAENIWRRYAQTLLPTNNIHTILVDPEGTVWLGTAAGVTGLQGQPAIVYQYNGKGPGSNRIVALLEDTSGNLWVGTEETGVSVRLADTANRDGTGGVWRTFDRNTSLLPDNMVSTLLLDGEGGVWVGTSNGVVICSTDGCRSPDRAPELEIGAVNIMALDSLGYPWIGTEGGLVWCHPKCEAIPFVSTEITQLEPAAEGQMWVATADSGTYVCQKGDCQVNTQVTPIAAAQPLYPPVTMLSDKDGQTWVALSSSELVLCAADGSCATLKRKPVYDLERLVVGLAQDSQGRLWLASAGGTLELCDDLACERQDGWLDLGDVTQTSIQMIAGISGDMWIAAGEQGAFHCSTPDKCVKLPLARDSLVQAVLPGGADWAWVGDLNYGLQRCTAAECAIIPADGAPRAAYEPNPGRPWVRLTANATLPDEQNKLLDTRQALIEDTRQVLIEFEGGSLTTPALKLSYRVTVQDQETGQVITHTFSPGEIGSASPGQVQLGESTPLEYHPYQVAITVQDPRGNLGVYEYSFSVQAYPSIQAIQVDGLAVKENLINLSPADTYIVSAIISDTDSADEIFTIQYRWAAAEVPEEEAPWQTLASHLLFENRIDEKIKLTDDPRNISALSLRVIDADGNTFDRTWSVTFDISRPWWQALGPYLLSILIVVTVGFYALVRTSGLSAGTLAHQGVRIFTVGLGYSRFHKTWQNRTPFERLLLLLIPAGQTFKPETLEEQLKQLEIPAKETQIEHALEVLLQAQILERSDGGYRVAEPALLDALQTEEGEAGRVALCQQIRSEHPLFAEAQRFFSAAGFDCRVSADAMAFTCAPALSSWQKLFDRPVYTRIFPGKAIDRQDVESCEAALNDSPAGQQIVFIVVDQTPSDVAWLHIGTLRAEGKQVIPIDDAIIQRGREQQKERQALQSHLRRYLGRRRDLYNVRDPVADRLNFFGRVAQSVELLETLSEGRPIALLGLRKMGKSSLMQYLRDKASFPVALVDLQAGSDLDGLYTRILESWRRSMRVKFPDFQWDPPTLPPSQATDSTAISSAFSAAAQDLMAQLESSGYAPQLGLFVDEIEVIVPHEQDGRKAPDPKALERYLAFARTLRGLLQETGDLALMVVGVDPRLNRINRWGTRQNPFYQFFREEYLGPLGRQDCIQMVRNIGRQMGLAYTDNAVEFVADASGGHPFLARQLCSAALRGLDQTLTGKITLGHLQAAAECFVRDPNTGALLNERGLWGEVTNPELWPSLQILENQTILTSLAETDRQPESDILAAGRDRTAREQSVFELKQRAVLGKLKEMLRIQFGLFQNWIQRYQLSK